jgi:uncharacterized phage-associated protein
MRFAYDQTKAGELAAQLLDHAGGAMPMLKLLKLMYLVDRTSLIETGFPVTGDKMVAMGNGPVLSKTYDHLKPTGTLPFVEGEPGNVRRDEKAPSRGRLSDYEIELALRIFKEFGAMSGEKLIDYLHRTVPEWKAPPVGSSVLIDPADILRAAGKSESEIAAIAAQADYFYVVESRTA